MHKLEQYYSGDENWQNFVELYDEFWNKNDFEMQLLEKLNRKIDLAKVINGKMGKNSLSIIEKKIPALDNISVIECLDNPKLILRLRECLMRMP